jgi:outer membrane protein assembly factor BamB
LRHANLKGDAAWDPVTNMLYVANTTDSTGGPFKHGIVALKARRNCSLSLAWQSMEGPPRSIGLPPPTIANGVVYYGDGDGYAESAYDAATGKELWRSSTIAGSVYASATVVNGLVFVPAWDGKLYAFGIGAGEGQRRVYGPARREAQTANPSPRASKLAPLTRWELEHHFF